MENSSVPHYQDNMHQAIATLYQHNYPSSEGYSSLSPVSSIDSNVLSPLCVGHATPQEACDNISTPCSQPMDLQPKIPSENKTKRMKGKLPYTQRQSASDREKMRMRDLSKALQNLRGYLPPSVAPINKTLTKIETLQLTIRYISLLSEQLGLSEEVLKQRRQASVQRTRCDQSSSCYMDMSQSLCSNPVKENMASTTSKERLPSQGTPYIDPRWQNMQPSSPTPYELRQYSALPVRATQNYYATTSAALPQYSALPVGPIQNYYSKTTAALSQYSALPVGPIQNHYPKNSAALSQSTSYCGTSHQQMVVLPLFPVRNTLMAIKVVTKTRAMKQF
ncbi:uncharacterized protein RB166_008065 [Leptodactylus fuscus]|uniref:uncharacterized protein LOC142204498 n=1 Tax=Leptodactylus fuscus TaxID=238119 RepID=UPI003F4E6FC5